MTHRPQHNFIDTARDFPDMPTPPPAPIDQRGDLRSDPLPIPPGWTDSTDPDAAGVPPKALTPSERRLVAHMETVQVRLLAAGANDDTDALRAELDYPRGPVSPTTLDAAWRAGQRYVDAIARVDTYRSTPAFAHHDDDDARIRAELADDNCCTPRWDSLRRAVLPDGLCDRTPPGATETLTRYNKGLPHTDDCVCSPQGVPDGYADRQARKRHLLDKTRSLPVPQDAFGRSRESHLLAQALADVPPHVASDQQAERAAADLWADCRRIGGHVAWTALLLGLAFAGGVAFAGFWNGR